jgi:NAD(P)-dependent dehydrogenase (short-subunit alcohol dehydrogenase family)
MSNQQFEGKVVAITGAASGIGLATAKLLARRGARLSIADLNEKNLEAAAKEIKSINPVAEVITTAIDVRNAQSVEEWIKKTKSHFGKIDGAANLAGVFKAFADKTVGEEDEDNWNFMLGVNLTGVMHCMRAEIPEMGSGGAIVNAASILGITGSAGAAAYSASKHGVVGLTRSAAKDVGKRNIRVNCIAP